MSVSEKKVKFWNVFLNWTVSVLLAFFLIALFSKILSDVVYIPQPEYIDKYKYVELYAPQDKTLEQIDIVKDSISNLIKERNNISKQVGFMFERYDIAEKSFDNWVAARRATELEGNNANVIDETSKTELILDSIAALKSNIHTIRDREDSLEVVLNSLNEKFYHTEQKISELNDNNYSYYNLKLFLIRLLITLPILVLGVLFFVKFRKHKYKALFMGVSIFALYLFFFALLPYLPSFGGYVRSIVGLVLTIVMGIYGVKYWNKDREKKRVELKQAASERKVNLSSQVAYQSYTKHLCPSCGKDFTSAVWERKYNEQQDQNDYLPHFCMHCGMELYNNCSNCHKLIYVHMPYCKWCGTKFKNEITTNRE